MRVVYSMRTCVVWAFISIFSVSGFSQGFGDRLDADPRLAPFYHGVASGDPLSDRVILWTRITDDDAVSEGIWRIATDSTFTENLQVGNWTTDASKDFTVKIDATGLSPNTSYYYQFETQARTSVTGRTKTTPIGSVDSYRIVFISCGDMTTGYFNVLTRITERNDFDAIYHLGDYIYEYESDKYLSSGIKVRDVDPAEEIISLSDYRARYSHYRLDRDLRKMHQQYPFIITWDDHETANDSYKGGASNHSLTDEGDWEDRKLGAAQAFHEWMPIRTNDSMNLLDITRSFEIGDLATFFLPESRLQYRNKQEGLYGLFPNLDNSDRGMLHPDNLNWFKDGLKNSTSKWKIMVSPVTFSTLFISQTPAFRNPDLWDGYPWQRKNILNHIVDNNIQNFVAISGDYHMAYALDIPYKIQDPYNTNNYNPATGEGSIGVNFAGTSYSSAPCCPNTPTDGWKALNPHMKYANVTHNGYSILDISPDVMTCDYFYVTSNKTRNSDQDWWETSLCVKDSSGHLEICDGPSVFTGTSTSLAPYGQDAFILAELNGNIGEIIGVHPVPAIDVIGVQFFLQKSAKVKMYVFNMEGKVVKREMIGMRDRGIHYHNLDISSFAKGSYIMSIRNEDNRVISSRKIVKM